MPARSSELSGDTGRRPQPRRFARSRFYSNTDYSSFLIQAPQSSFQDSLSSALAGRFIDQLATYGGRLRRGILVNEMINLGELRHLANRVPILAIEAMLPKVNALRFGNVNI